MQPTTQNARQPDTQSGLSVTDWFGSSGREKHCNAIAAIPRWKRLALCMASYRKWKLARACDHTAIHAIKRLDDYALFDRLLKISDEQWAEIFNLPNKD